MLRVKDLTIVGLKDFLLKMVKADDLKDFWDKAIYQEHSTNYREAYLDMFFSKFNECEDNMDFLETTFDYARKLKVLEKMGFFNLTFIKETSSDWHGIDSVSMKNGQIQITKCFTNQDKINPEYGKYDEKEFVRCRIKDPDYVFYVNYEPTEYGEFTAKIKDNQLMLQSLDFDLESFPDRTDIQDWTCDYSEEELNELKEAYYLKKLAALIDEEMAKDEKAKQKTL